MAAPEPVPIALDAWGLPIILPDPPALDAELGVTTSDDGWIYDDSLPLGKFLQILLVCSLHCAWGLFRLFVLITGIHKRKPR